MTLLVQLMSQRKLVLTLALLLSLLGLFFWFNMARQEDPRLPDLWGQVVTAFPGADAETVERLVLEPLEERLAAVDEIKEIASTAYAGVAVMKIDLLDNIRDTDRAWDEVREALVKAREDFPEGAGEPSLNDELQDNESIVYALTGHPDPLELRRRAEDLKDLLLALPEVSEVKLVADPEEQVTILLNDAAARRLGLQPQLLAAQLQARNRILPGGSVELGGRNVTLRPVSELESLEEVRATPVTLPNGSSVPLGTVASVLHGPVEPATSYLRFNGQPGLGIGIVPRKGGNILLFGKAVRELMDEQIPRLAPIQVDEVIFQPDRVETRLRNLSRSLLLGVMIVAGVLMLVMGLRLGIIVASVVPLVVLTSLAIYAISGGILHQISIAALVIALGMLVDNAIVMAESIQWRLDHGEPRSSAAAASVRELAVPLAAATTTTLAAFIPMLLAEGGTGEFTRAIPIVIMLTLTISYLFAIFVTPSLSEMFLRRHPVAEHAAGSERARRLGRFALRRPGLVLVLAGVAVVISLLGFGGVRQEFFPSSDRNQLVVDLRLPEGSHLDATDRQARELERALLDHPQVVSVATFVGRSTPKFYYNLNFIPFSPHLAQMVVETTSTRTLDPIMAWLRGYAHDEMPEVELVVRKLEQGPTIEAPVEIRLYGNGLEELHTGAEAVLTELRRIPGTEDVRQTLGSGAPMLRFEVDDAAAARRGLNRSDVALALFGRTRGLPVGEFRAGDDPVPMVVRSTAGENYPIAELEQIDVAGAGGEPVPLSQVARVDLRWRPAAIHHHNGRRVVRVLSELDGGTGYEEVLGQLLPRLEEFSFPEGVSWVVGGAEEGSGEANVAMMRVMPVGVLLLLGILMAEFRSFRRVAIVLVTVPLAAAGIVPGLLVSGQPFGFMSLLGVFALVGVVVNNAIVLL
ncbi:MAG: efflux RND transporter permease subunit, partial [Acidobacteria bacterium]|nr:efflux RND transporter permease subunit [Acidobacteriota bacterium]